MNDDETFEVPPVPEGRVPLRIAGQVAAVGALAGGLEGLIVGWRSRLLLTGLERAELTLGAVVADSLLAFAAGLVGGVIAWRMRGWTPLWRRYQRGFGAAWTLLTAFALLPLVAEMARRGDLKNVVGSSVVLASTSFMGFLLSGFAYRREFIGLTPRIGFRIPAAFGALALVGLSVLVGQEDRPPTNPPPPQATNVVLISVDTLRRDALGTYGSATATPNLDRLAREGAAFDAAITPLPETAPSHSAMLTGQHPRHTGVVQNGRALSLREQTVAEQFQAVGWRTGAFVSSFALDSSVGLDQGFEVYDDDFAPRFRGIAEFRAGWLGLRLLLRYGDPADWPALLERRGDATVARALAWVDTVPPEQPIFLWVHLFDPHSPYDLHGEPGPEVDHRAILAKEPGYAYSDAEVEGLKRQYAAEVHFTDAQIGVLLDGLRARHRLDQAAVLAVGDHGESLGEHGIHFNHHGLYDDVLRVPLLLWQTRMGWEPGARNDDQVTEMDVANTLLEAAGVPKLVGTRSQALQDRLGGAQQPGSPQFLLGRTDSAWLYGIRSPNGVKYLETDAGAPELYSLPDDPHELHDLAPTQEKAVRQAHESVQGLKRGVDHSAPEGATAEMLEALGYTDPDATLAAPELAPAGAPPAAPVTPEAPAVPPAPPSSGAPPK